MSVSSPTFKQPSKDVIALGIAGKVKVLLKRNHPDISDGWRDRAGSTVLGKLNDELDKIVFDPDLRVKMNYSLEFPEHKKNLSFVFTIRHDGNFTVEESTTLTPREYYAKYGQLPVNYFQ